MAIQVHITDADNFFVGEDKILEYQVKDTTGNIIDITGWSIEWVLREDPDTSTVLVTKDNGGNGGLSITNAVNGIFQVTMDAADTSALPEGRYAYGASRTDTGLRGLLVYGDASLQIAASR